MVKEMVKYVISFVFAAMVGLAMIIGRQSEETTFRARRLIAQGEEDHMGVLHERHTDPGETYNQNTMQLMSSPCRPESDGLFGSTVGEPIEIQYGFELETDDHDKVDTMLEDMNEKVMDMLLSSAFPSLCGYKNRNRQLSAVHSSYLAVEAKKSNITTGYHFGNGFLHRTSTCIPVVDPTNLCGVYMNTVSIYGKRLEGIGEERLNQISRLLVDQQPLLAHQGLVRLAMVDYLTTVINGQTPGDAIGDVSLVMRAAIAMAFLAIVAGVFTLVLYILLDRQNRMESHPGIVMKSTKSTDLTGKSENVGLCDGSAIVMEDGRPVVIAFDQDVHSPQVRTDDDRSTLSGSTHFGRSSASVTTQSNTSVARTVNSLTRSVRTVTRSVTHSPAPINDLTTVANEVLDSHGTLVQVGLDDPIQEVSEYPIAQQDTLGAGEFA